MRRAYLGLMMEILAGDSGTITVTPPIPPIGLDWLLVTGPVLFLQDWDFVNNGVTVTDDWGSV